MISNCFNFFYLYFIETSKNTFTNDYGSERVEMMKLNVKI